MPVAARVPGTRRLCTCCPGALRFQPLPGSPESAASTVAASQVLIVDPNPRAPWVNNYGVWIDEFELMGLADCLDVTWDKALVHLDATPEGKR